MQKFFSEKNSIEAACATYRSNYLAPIFRIFFVNLKLQIFKKMFCIFEKIALLLVHVIYLTHLFFLFVFWCGDCGRLDICDNWINITLITYGYL